GVRRGRPDARHDLHGLPAADGRRDAAVACRRDPGGNADAPQPARRQGRRRRGHGLRGRGDRQCGHRRAPPVGGRGRLPPPLPGSRRGAAPDRPNGRAFPRRGRAEIVSPRTPRAPSPVGQSLRRREDPRLLRGMGRYLDDLIVPGALHLAFVRSPHAHAVLRSVDARRALALPGVVAVLAASELPLPSIRAEFHGEGYHGAGWPALAQDRVRFVGEAVAVVAAHDRYVAEDAVDVVEVAYSPLPVVASAAAALQRGSACLHDAVPENVYFRRSYAWGDVEGAFAAAPVIVAGTFRHQRLSGVPLEGRGIAARWEAGGRLTVWASTQLPHVLRTGLARLLNLPETSVRVFVPDVGGGFGPKMTLYPEDLVACAVARLLARPVKWVEDRRENLLTMTHAREQTIEAAMAAAPCTDPAAVRRANFVRAQEFPHTSASGLVYDSGDYQKTVDAALAAFRYPEARAEQTRGRAGGRLVGIGLSAFTEYTGMGST